MSGSNEYKENIRQFLRRTPISPFYRVGTPYGFSATFQLLAKERTWEVIREKMREVTEKYLEEHPE